MSGLLLLPTSVLLLVILFALLFVIGRFTRFGGMMVGALPGFGVVALVIGPCLLGINPESCNDGMMLINFMTLMVPAIISNSNQPFMVTFAFAAYTLLGGLLGHVLWPRRSKRAMMAQL